MHSVPKEPMPEAVLRHQATGLSQSRRSDEGNEDERGDEGFDMGLGFDTVQVLGLDEMANEDEQHRLWVSVSENAYGAVLLLVFVKGIRQAWTQVLTLYYLLLLFTTYSLLLTLVKGIRQAWTQAHTDSQKFSLCSHFV